MQVDHRYPRERIMPAHATEQIRYAIRDVTVLANRLRSEGRRVLYLNIGDPNVYDFDMVDEAKAAAIWAIQNGKNGYAPSEGLPEALEAIRRDAELRQNIRTVIGCYMGNGASECIDLAMSALVNPGDNVLVPSPNYPLYDAILTRLNVEARYYRLEEREGWQPDTDHMASLIDERTRAVVVINPNNPTGALYLESCLRRVIELAKTHHLLVFNDEIYSRFILNPEREHVSLASLDDEVCCVTFSGLSKAYFAPGVRIGWGIVSGPHSQLDDYFDAITRMLRARLCANHPFQWAVKPCLESGHHFPAMREKLRRRRDVCMRKIAQTPGLSCVEPQGSFYAFVRVEGVSDDVQWCKSLLMQKGVVVVPGSGFSFRDENAAYFRIVFLPQEDILEEAFEKIAEFMRENA